jgi:glycine cleavage system regulatory protein
MSIAKAFLMGAVKGGLKENNQRARRMEERMLALADNNAAMARERAQSQYDNTTKAAATISSTQAGLVNDGFIDTETGEYTKKYYDNEAYLEWKNPEVRKAYGGVGGEKKFKEEYSKLKKKKAFVNPYKSAQERDGDLIKLHESISARQQVEASQPVLTGIDKLLMKGSQSGMTPRPSQEVPALAEASPMVAQVPQAPEEEYTGVDFNVTSAPSTPRKGLNLVNLYSANGIDGKTYQQDPSTGQLLDENTGQWLQTPEGMTTISANRNPFTMFYTDDQGFEVQHNVIETYPSDPLATVRQAGKSYVPVGNAIRKGDVSLEPIKKGEFTQQTNNSERFTTVNKVSNLTVEMLGQDYVSNPKTWIASRLASIGDALGATVNLTGKTEQDVTAITSYIEGRLKDDWQAMKDIGPLDAAAIAEGNTKAIQTLLTYATTSMLTKDGRITVSNPKTWIASRLASIGDALGATVNLTGKTEQDVTAITSYIEGRLKDDWQAMKDIGPLDAAAIAEGNTKAIQTLLTYATTSMLTKDGRITVLATESAKEITESFVTGGAVHAGKLVSILNQNSMEMASIIDSDLNVAMSNMRSPTWQRYPDVKRMVQDGWKPLSNNFEGDKIKINLEKLMTSDPTAYRKSISSLAQTPFDIDSLDEKTIYYNNKYKKNIMLYSTLNPDGSYAFSANRVQ